MPSRLALVTIASGDSPVSNSRVVVLVPRRTLTSAEKPCSAIIPTVVDPVSNCGACVRPAVRGARVVRSSLVSRPSNTLSTSVVITISSTGSQRDRIDRGSGRGTRDGHRDLPRVCW